MVAPVRCLDRPRSPDPRGFRPYRLALLITLPGVLLASGPCDHAGKIITVVPEFDITDSFESGLGQWTPVAIDLGEPAAPWSIEGSDEEASAGSRSVKLTLDNINGAAKTWIERELEVAPGQAYDVDISFDLGSADVGALNLWTVIAGAYAEPPRDAFELTFQDDTGNGAAVDDGYHWMAKSYTVHARSNEEGYLYVTIGVRGTSESARSYYVDNVRLQLTRAG